MVTNLVAMPGAPNGTAAVSMPLTSFSWCQASMRPTGARALTFSGMAARVITASLTTSSTASPASEYARQPARTGQQLGVPGQPTCIPGSSNSTAGQDTPPAHPSRPQDPHFQPSHQPGAEIARTGLRTPAALAKSVSRTRPRQPQPAHASPRWIR
jgi:hypothetical protein